jgi:hypothetical protein
VAFFTFYRCTQCNAVQFLQEITAESYRPKAVLNMKDTNKMNMAYSILLNAKEIKSDFIHEFSKICISSETLIALADKVHHIIIHKGDLQGAIRMLSSFKNGTKRLPTDKYNTYDGQRNIWKQSAHGEYLWKPQLPRAHFRWNKGERYTLTVDELIKVEKFLKKHGLNHL